MRIALTLFKRFGFAPDAILSMYASWSLKQGEAPRFAFGQEIEGLRESDRGPRVSPSQINLQLGPY